MDTKLVDSLCALASIELFDNSEHGEILKDAVQRCTDNNIILLSTHRIAIGKSINIRSMLNQEITKGWVAFPSPPQGFEAVDIATAMLYSEMHTFNTTSFPWSNASESTFQCLWRLLERIAATSADKDPIRKLMDGRGIISYSLSRGIEMYTIDDRNDTFAVMNRDLVKMLYDHRNSSDNNTKYPRLIAKSKHVDTYVELIAESIMISARNR